MRERSATEARKARAAAPTTPLDFTSGGKVYFDDSDGWQPGDRAKKVLAENGMLQVRTALEAADGYIVVRDLDKGAPRCLRMVALLAGGALITREYFERSARAGSCLSWNAAVKVRRKVWLSPEWAAAEPLVAASIRWAARLPASRWELPAWDAATYARRQGAATVVGVVSDRQKALRTFAAQRHTLCTEGFLDFVAKLHAPTSGTVTVGPASSAGWQPLHLLALMRAWRAPYQY